VKPLRLALVGASGRMGRAIERLANESRGAFVVVARASSAGELAAVPESKPSVAIDFSTPESTRAFASVAMKAGLPLVVGTTGLAEDDARALEAAAAVIPVFVASNMSVGVHVLGELVARATAMLGDAFDLEIVEAHHRDKVDAPSGTALALLAIAERARRADREAPHEQGGRAPTVYGRSGRAGPRPRGEIAVHAIRGGDVIGDHHVEWLGDGERLEIVHRATSRDVFARGALRAAEWLVEQPCGLYGMRDLLG
jgi:4-hydroxy-tetrahydrodipicolinate reductase